MSNNGNENPEKPGGVPPKTVRMPERGAPKGWRCDRQGHFADSDHPPMGSPVVETTNGYFIYPAARCLVCRCIYSEKQPLSPAQVEKMKQDAARQQRAARAQAESALVGPNGEKLGS